MSLHPSHAAHRTWSVHLLIVDHVLQKYRLQCSATFSVRTQQTITKKYQILTPNEYPVHWASTQNLDQYTHLLCRLLLLFRILLAKRWCGAYPSRVGHHDRQLYYLLQIQYSMLQTYCRTLLCFDYYFILRIALERTYHQKPTSANLDVSKPSIWHNCMLLVEIGGFPEASTDEDQNFAGCADCNGVDIGCEHNGGECDRKLLCSEGREES